MPLPPAEGGAIPNALGEIAESSKVALGSLVWTTCLWCLRHDLPPVETSQVSSIFLGDEAIGDKDILPAVIIQIDEERAPGPAPHGRARGDADVAEATLAVVLEKGVSPGVPLVEGPGLEITSRFELVLKSNSVSGRGKPRETTLLNTMDNAGENVDQTEMEG